VVLPDGRTTKAIDYEEGFRIAVSAAYEGNGTEVRLLEPGQDVLVFTMRPDRGLRVRSETDEGRKSNAHRN
jgi:hypothetical protein